MERPTLVSTDEDTIMWRWGATGEYSSKSAYAILMSAGKIKWRFNNLWHAKCPMTAKIFMYMALKGKILTDRKSVV